LTVKIFLIKLEKTKIKRIIKIILIAVIEEEINQKIIAKNINNNSLLNI
jgi:hypothetical protein